METRSLALRADLHLLGPSARCETARRLTVDLFRDLRQPLSRYIVSLGLRPAEAEELVQEAFLRLHQHLCASSASEQNLTGWVYRVAQNLVRDRQRGWHKRNVDSINDRPEAAIASAPGVTPEQRVLEMEKTDRLRTAMKTLSAEHRQCLHLRAEGLRYREIAAAMGIGVSTVADMIRQALAQLEKALGDV